MDGFPTDAFPAAVQSSGKVASAEMVPAPAGEREEEDCEGYDHYGVGAETTHMQLPALEGPEDCL